MISVMVRTSLNLENVLLAITVPTVLDLVTSMNVNEIMDTLDEIHEHYSSIEQPLVDL